MLEQPMCKCSIDDMEMHNIHQKEKPRSPVSHRARSRTASKRQLTTSTLGDYPLEQLVRWNFVQKHWIAVKCTISRCDSTEKQVESERWFRMCEWFQSNQCVTAIALDSHRETADDDLFTKYELWMMISKAWMTFVRKPWIIKNQKWSFLTEQAEWATSHESALKVVGLCPGCIRDVSGMIRSANGWFVPCLFPSFLKIAPCLILLYRVTLNFIHKISLTGILVWNSLDWSQSPCEMFTISWWQITLCQPRKPLIPDNV